MQLEEGMLNLGTPFIVDSVAVGETNPPQAIIESVVKKDVRISPFNAAGKRQTSFASCDVVPDIEDDIDIELNDDDLKIDTYRAVSYTHLVFVKCFVLHTFSSISSAFPFCPMTIPEYTFSPAPIKRVPRS